MSEPSPQVDQSTTATARLPGLDIELRHRVLPDRTGEEITLRLRAVASFEALGRFMDTPNLFMLWTEAARLAWEPWLQAARVRVSTGNAGPRLPNASRGPEH